MNIVKCTYIINGSHGQYIPQTFAEQYPEWIDDPEDLQILLAGHDHEYYNETWDSILYSEHDGKFLTYSEGGNDLLICKESPMQNLIVAFANGEGLEDCPYPDLVRKIAHEFTTDGPEWVSEEEAIISNFAPFQYNTSDVNKALEWMQHELRGAQS